VDFSTLASLARRVQAVVSEMNYASRRVTALRLSQGLEPSDRAPDTYAEFLLRTSVTPLHEPPARCR
jgi:predicted phosphoadenosine phosphosulfate sulfurtransferase